MNLSRIDRHLLNELQKNARTPVAALAEAAGTSTASVQRHLKRLRESGIIEREVAVIDQSASDTPMTFIVLVEVERESLDRLDDFRRRARAEDAVQQCYCVAGETDFVIIAQARDMADYEAFTHRFFFKDTNVRRFRTNVTITRDKVGLAVSL
ncbi:MAG: Lrp/AsnC family transcriptional regulator [Pseudoruegeria sp.]